MKILLLDLETAPKKAYVWRLWKENVGKHQLLKHGYILSAAWKWLDIPGVSYIENRTEDDKDVVETLAKVMDKADLVIAHNAQGFDIPLLKARAVIHRIAPWSPVKVIDTLAVAKREFKFDRNSLDFVADILGVEAKQEHKEFPGFELWAQCLLGNPRAWAEMRKYNIQDVITLEQVYLALRPWISNHPNVAVHEDHLVPVCPKCGSKHVHRRGYYYTNVGKYHRFQCKDCGGWGRTRYTENSVEVRRNLMTNAV